MSLGIDSVAAIASVGAGPPHGAPSSTTSGRASSSGPVTEDVAVSQDAQYVQQIRALAESDPAAASRYMVELAARLRADAQTSGPADAAHLIHVADLISKAAPTLDWRSLASAMGATEPAAAYDAHAHAITAVR